MRVLVGWAGDSSPNLGVRVLGRGSADLIHMVWPDADIEFMDFGQRPAQIPWGRGRSLIRERVTGKAGMMRWLGDFDLYWDTRSGDSFADIYGLDRHVKMSLIHEFAVEAGVSAVMAPQTIGPFHTVRGKMLAKRNLARSSLVFARDPVSAVAAGGLGRPVDRMTSDLVFAIDAPVVEVRSDVLMNVSGLLWEPNPHVEFERYRAAMRSTIDRLLADGRRVTLLPHVIDSPFADTDGPVTRELAQEYDGRIDTHFPSDLEDARALIAGANLVIAARMHACLNAISTGVPAIALAYSRKFQPLLQEIGWPHVVSLSDPEIDIPSAIHELTARDDLTVRAGAAREAGRASMVAMAQDLRDRL